MVIRARDTLYLKTNNDAFFMNIHLYTYGLGFEIKPFKLHDMHCMFFQLSLFVIKIQINLPIYKDHK